MSASGFMFPVILGLAGVLAAPIIAAISGIAQNEVCGWLDRFPLLLLRLARRRLPEPVRDVIYEEDWYPEMCWVLQRSEGLPLTRLYHGIRLALGLLLTAGRIGRQVTAGPGLGPEVTAIGLT